MVGAWLARFYSQSVIFVAFERGACCHSVSQKLICSLTRSCKDAWLIVQLVPGSGKGQSSREADQRRYTNSDPHTGGQFRAFPPCRHGSAGAASFNPRYINWG